MQSEDDNMAKKKAEEPKDKAPVAESSGMVIKVMGGAPGGEDLAEACGGSSRPNTLSDVVRMQGFDSMFAVKPALWCPHLKEKVHPLPATGLYTDRPCEECENIGENWVCLSCYKVLCSRYVKEHMLFHSVETEHVVVLSYADLSVWCYACNDYIDNEITFSMRNAAHISKFGESLAKPSQY